MKLNRLINLIAIAMALLAFAVTGSIAMLFVAFAVVFFTVASAPIAHAVGTRTTLSFDLKPSCAVHQDHALEIALERPLMLRGRIELSFECCNLFTGTRRIVPVTLAPASGSPERFTLPLDTDQVGRIAVTLVSARAVDVFGFSDTALNHVSFASSYTVYPTIDELAVTTARANRAATAGFVFDPHRKGQDASEVFELRDYRDGDSMRSIHWKLSARFDDLMVRVPSHPADFDLAIVFALHRRDVDDSARTDAINAAVSLAASLSRALLHSGIGHSVIYRNGAVLEDIPIDSEARFELMLDSVLGTTLPLDVSTDTKTFAAHQRARGVTKIALVTDDIHEHQFEEFSELCELNVIYIGGEDNLSVDESNGYVLTRISADAVGARVKSLEL